MNLGPIPRLIHFRSALGCLIHLQESSRALDDQDDTRTISKASRATHKLKWKSI